MSFSKQTLRSVAFPIALLAALIGCGGPKGGSGTRHEASMNFDPETLRAFLPRVERLVDSGFGPAEAGEILDLAETLDVGGEARRRFEVVYQGRTTPLEVQVVMDGVEAPDVYFFTSQELAGAIGGEMIAFGEELGI